MSKAIILSRVSTQIQELDSQTQAVKNEALKEGFKEKDLIIIDDTEERLIYGSISDTRAKDIEARLKDDINRYEADKEKLMKEMDHIEQLISIGIEKPDYDNFTLEEKRRLIRMMIKKVEIWKKSRYEPVAEVTPTVGSMRYILWINSYNGKCEMTTEPIE